MRHALVPAALLLAAPIAAAQEPATPEARPTGLPLQVKWTFNFDASWGTFGFANSLFDNPKNPGVQEHLSDQWFEGAMKPALSGAFVRPSASELYGKISAVGERTYGSVPSAFGEDVSSFGPEDLYLGWRSGKVLDLTVGRAPFTIGNGMLIHDGAAEGGSRGGYWTNARKAFQFAAIARLTPGAHTIESFYLDRDELEEADTGTRVWGVNYQLKAGDEDTTTIGATYMRLKAHADLDPGRDGLNVFNARIYTSPVPAAPDLSFAFEYAAERNGEARHADAWTLQGGYEWSETRWKPALTYRYAFFQGDDPSTPADEAFDPLFPGFSDWGTWWQGEIAGEYFLANSNLVSHLFRAHVTPSESISGGVLLYRFLLDHPSAFGPQVTAADAATELDLYTDWKVNGNFTVSLVGALAHPGRAVEQATGRTKNFAYGMAYFSYAF